jgi:ribonuclease HI
MTLYFDGSAEVGRHRSGAGAVLYTMNPDEVYDVSQEYGDMTNNCAEYCGLIMGLEMIKQYCPRAQQLIIRGDSQLIIRQMTGKYKVKAAGLIPFHQRATELINELIGPDKIASIEFEWIERSLNERADILSRRGNVAAQRVR